MCDNDLWRPVSAIVAWGIRIDGEEYSYRTAGEARAAVELKLTQGYTKDEVKGPYPICEIFEEE